MEQGFRMDVAENKGTLMPRSKKKKPGNGRSWQLETIFCIAMLGLFFLLWMLKEFFQATAGELIAVYFVGTIAMIVALWAIDPKAVEHVMDSLSRP
jgi:hypothetical protein